MTNKGMCVVFTIVFIFFFFNFFPLRSYTPRKGRRFQIQPFLSERQQYKHIHSEMTSWLGGGGNYYLVLLIGMGGDSWVPLGFMLS